MRDDKVDKVELAQDEIRRQLTPKIVKVVLETMQQYGGTGAHLLAFLENMCVVLIASRFRAEGYEETVDLLAAGVKERLAATGKALEARRQQREALDAATRRQ